MPSEPFVEDSGQGLLRLFAPPCARCQWGARKRKRCSGPQTVESLIENQGYRLSCYDTRKTNQLLKNLDRHGLPSQRYPILQGLPAAIPVLCEGMPDGICLDPRILYGVALDDLLHEDGRIKYSSGRDLRTAFHLPPEGRLCLLASVKDPCLEKMWSRSLADQVWKQIRRLRFEFVTGMTFSIFEMHSRNGQLLNQKRNLMSVDFLAREGVPVVPVFCEVVQEDLEFASRWLKRRPAIRVIAGLAQSWKTEQEFACFLWRMKFLKNHVQRPLHFLIIGCSTADRIMKLFQELQEVTVTDNLALRGAKGEWWDPDRLDFVTVPKGAWVRAEVIPSSFAGFTAFCESCARSTKRAA